MNKFPTPQASRKTYLKHRQDVLRQIILPIALVTLLVLGAAILIAMATVQGGDVNKWAAVATIWLVLPLMGLMLVLMVSAWGVVYLLVRLLQVTPRYTGIAQEALLRFNDQILLWIDRIIQPIIKIKAWLDMFSGKG